MAGCGLRDGPGRGPRGQGQVAAAGSSVRVLDGGCVDARVGSAFMDSLGVVGLALLAGSPPRPHTMAKHPRADAPCPARAGRGAAPSGCAARAHGGGAPTSSPNPAGPARASGRRARSAPPPAGGCAQGRADEWESPRAGAPLTILRGAGARRRQAGPIPHQPRLQSNAHSGCCRAATGAGAPTPAPPLHRKMHCIHT